MRAIVTTDNDTGPLLVHSDPAVKPLSPQGTKKRLTEELYKTGAKKDRRHMALRYEAASWQSFYGDYLRRTDGPHRSMLLWNYGPQHGNYYPLPVSVDFVSLTSVRILSCFSAVVFFLEDWLIARLYAYRWLTKYMKDRATTTMGFPERDALTSSANADTFEVQAGGASIKYQLTRWKTVVEAFVSEQIKRKKREGPTSVIPDLDKLLVGQPLDNNKYDTYQLFLRILDSLPDAAAFKGLFEKFIGQDSMGKTILEECMSRIDLQNKTSQEAKTALTDLSSNLSSAYWVKPLGDPLALPPHLDAVRSCHRLTLRARSISCSTLDEVVSKQLSDVFSLVWNAFIKGFYDYVNTANSVVPVRGHEAPATKDVPALGLLELQAQATIAHTIISTVRLRLVAILKQLKEREANLHQQLVSKEDTGDMSWHGLLELYRNVPLELSRKEAGNPRKSEHDAFVARRDLLLKAPPSVNNPLALGSGILALCSTRQLLIDVIDSVLLGDDLLKVKFVPGGGFSPDKTLLKAFPDTTAIDKSRLNVQSWSTIRNRTITAAELESLLERVEPQITTVEAVTKILVGKSVTRYLEQLIVSLAPMAPSSRHVDYLRRVLAVLSTNIEKEYELRVAPGTGLKTWHIKGTAPGEDPTIPDRTIYQVLGPASTRLPVIVVVAPPGAPPTADERAAEQAVSSAEAAVTNVTTDLAGAGLTQEEIDTILEDESLDAVLFPT